MEKIDCEFSLLDEGRVYTGHHRKYIIGAAKQMAQSPVTKEKIRLREAFGYFGHGRRVAAGKLTIDEVEVVKDKKTGAIAIMQNVPACVTLSLEVDDDGTVRHSQEVLDTEPGMIVSAMNAGKVGGFSWVCGGVDKATTSLTSFHGFDYVRNPGFSPNRGYVLESAGSNFEAIADMLMQSGLSVERISAWIEAMQVAPIYEAAELRAKISEYESSIDSLREDLERLATIQSREEKRRTAIMEAAGRSIVVVSQEVTDALCRLETPKDIETIQSFFESAGRIRHDLPIFDNPAAGMKVKQQLSKKVDNVNGERRQNPYAITLDRPYQFQR